jgi:hypothetical protein
MLQVLPINTQDAHPLPIVTFADLSNAKIVMLSPKPPYYIVEKYFLQTCLRALTERIPFDEQWYLAKYPDVAGAIRHGKVQDAHEHYVQHGYFEHRMPFRISVNTPWYLNQNPDVRDAVAQRHFSSAQEHFELIGYREGRLPFEGFSLHSRPTSAPAESEESAR